MAKSDPTKEPEFQRVLGNLLKAPPKPHSEMKVGKAKAKKAMSRASDSRSRSVQGKLSSANRSKRARTREEAKNG
jgi:hypothetical protein